MVIHQVSQDDKSQPIKQDQQDRGFVALMIKYLNIDSIKSVIFTKLESSTSPRRACITYKIESEADDNLMPFKYSKHYFQIQQEEHCMPQRTMQ